MNPSRSFLRLAIPAMLLLGGCANQKEPGGGPLDTTPPQIIATLPKENAVRVSEGRIALEFDKYVDQRSFTESVFISPSPGELEFDWSGKRVNVTFGKPLRPSTTYVVNIGTDVTDLHSNRLAHAFVLAFSTGSEIDRGGIEGCILTRQAADAPSGVMIFAYRLEGKNADTLNPRMVAPDYITQTGKDGSFGLRHLLFGSYRLIAVRDEYRNLLYDPEADDYGVPSSPILLTDQDTLAAGLMIRLAREDTTAPRLIKAEARDRRHVQVQFSEAMDWNGMIPQAFAIIDTVNGMPLSASSVFSPVRPLTALTLVTDAQDTNAAYRITVSGVRDSSGLPISPAANALRFRGSGTTDTLKTRPTSITPTDSSKGVDRNVAVHLAFSDAMARPVGASAFQWKDEFGVDVRFTLTWDDGASLTLRPVAPLQGETWYRLTAPLRALKDFAGRELWDSTRTISFRTLDPEMLASIEGRVSDWKPRTPGARLVVTARSLGGRSTWSTQVAADATGAFIIPAITEGKYILQAFEDTNGNGAYDTGSPWPYRMSEPLGMLSDTLKVRARWPLDGVILRMMPVMKPPTPPAKAKADTTKEMKGK